MFSEKFFSSINKTENEINNLLNMSYLFDLMRLNTIFPLEGSEVNKSLIPHIAFNTISESTFTPRNLSCIL